jgi:hypothetical protein
MFTPWFPRITKYYIRQDILCILHKFTGDAFHLAPTNQAQALQPFYLSLFYLILLPMIYVYLKIISPCRNRGKAGAVWMSFKNRGTSNRKIFSIFLPYCLPDTLHIKCFCFATKYGRRFFQYAKSVMSQTLTLCFISESSSGA